MEPIYREKTEKLHLSQLKHFTDVVQHRDNIILLIGDSVLELLVREEQFGGMELSLPDNVQVFAKGGDRIQHLLWRLERIPDSDKVTKIILHIGTNNLSPKKSVDPIVEGCLKVVKIVKEKFSNADISFLSFYPRKDIPSPKILELNDKLEKKTRLDRSVWNGVLPDDGEYHGEFYRDHVHLNKESYNRFYENLVKMFES